MNQRICLSYYNHFFKQLCQIWFHNNLRNYFVDNQTRKWSEKYLLKPLDQILQVHFKPLDKIFPRCIYPNSMGDLARKKRISPIGDIFRRAEKANTQVHN